MTASQDLLHKTQQMLEYLQDPNFTLRSLQQYDHLYKDLIDILIGHNILYYQQQSPIIADEIYDKLFAALKMMESRFPEIVIPESPSQLLTGQIQDEFVKAQHRYPLLSLENTYSLTDVQDRYESITRMIIKSDQVRYQGKDFDPQLVFICQPKYDGIAVELVYEQGKFVQAITRGDGQLGEDITQNVATLNSVPKVLHGHYPHQVSIRGEIVMPLSVFHQLNNKKIEQGETHFINPRNACSGSIKQLDPQVTAQRGLVVYVYDILSYAGLDIDTQGEIQEQLKNWGFHLYPWSQVCHTITELQTTLSDDKIQDQLNQADIDFDGIVVKVNQLHRCDVLGYTNHHPRRAMAYKFPAKQIHTRLLGIEYQVGRLGTITPVAVLQATQLAGVTISKASLHNFDFIRNKDIRIGDQVVIQRSGEVIPYVVSVVTAVRDGSEQMITIPFGCPVCQTPVIQQDVFILCPNQYCKAKIKQQILHFVSRHGMNIEGCGESIVDMLVESGILQGWLDIYRLSDPTLRTTLKSLPLIGDKKLDQLISQIEKSKSNELWRIIYALGIPNVGKKTALMITEAIAEYVADRSLPTLDAGWVIHIILSEHFLTSIFGLGEKSVQAIQEYLHNPEYVTRMMSLQHYGVRFDHLPQQKDHHVQIQTSLSGKHIAISGTFDLSRTALAQILVGQGAIYDDTISRKTDILIIGNKGGSKIQKAQQRGISIIHGIDELLLAYPCLDISLQAYTQKPELGLFA